MRPPSQESSDFDMRTTEVPINKPSRPALPTSRENVNNAPLFTSPRHSIDDRLRKHENQPKRAGVGALAGSRAGSRTHSLETMRSSSQHRPRCTPQNPSQSRSSSQAPLQTRTNQTPKSQLPRTATSKPRAGSKATPIDTSSSMSQSKTPRNRVRTAQPSEQGSSRIPRPSVSAPQTPHSDDLEHLDVRASDHAPDPMQPNNSTAAPVRQVQPSNAAKDIIVKAIAVAESDISRYKGLHGRFSDDIEQLTSQIIRDLERAGLATIQVAATDASVTSPSSHDISEFIHRLQGALSHHEDRVLKRLESHHTGMRHHGSRVGNEIKSLINSQTTKVTSEVQQLGRAFRTRTLARQSEFTPPNSRAAGSSGRKRPRTSSPSIMVEDTNN
ncbi:hypothetical protein ACKVWC_003275 [Pyricularia oryzae]